MASEISVSNCVNLLEQALNLIERIDDDVYGNTNSLSPRGSIGGHLRHILDFYQNFLAGLTSGSINYNLRQRDTRIEQDRDYAIQTVSKTITALRSLSGIHDQTHFRVSVESSSDQIAVWCDSSALRELDFLQSHTVHHFSLIGMLLRLHEIDPGEDFGVASSTLKYWKEEASCAQ